MLRICDIDIAIGIELIKPNAPLYRFRLWQFQVNLLPNQPYLHEHNPVISLRNLPLVRILPRITGGRAEALLERIVGEMLQLMGRLVHVSGAKTQLITQVALPEAMRPHQVAASLGAGRRERIAASCLLYHPAAHEFRQRRPQPQAGADGLLQIGKARLLGIDRGHFMKPVEVAQNIVAGDADGDKGLVEQAADNAVARRQ